VGITTFGLDCNGHTRKVSPRGGTQSDGEFRAAGGGVDDDRTTGAVLWGIGSRNKSEATGGSGLGQPVKGRSSLPGGWVYQPPTTEDVEEV